MAIYSRSNARRSLFDTVIFRAFSQVATLLSYVVMVRGMTKEDFGVFNLLYAFIPVVGTLASFGLDQTLRRYQPEYLRAGNHVAAEWLVKFVSSARFGTTVVVLAIVLLAWNLVAPLFKLEPYRAQFALFSLLVLFHFQVVILQLSLASRMLHRLSVGSMALLAYIKLVAYLAFVWFDSMTLVNAILADTVGYAVVYTSLRWFYQKRKTAPGEKTGELPTREEKRRMLRYGFYNNFNDTGTLLLNSRSDNFFIAAVLDPVSVGIYSFYTRLREMVAHLVPSIVFQNVIQPLFFSIELGEASRKIPRYFSLMLNLNLVSQLPILAYTIAYHAEIVEVLFGPKYVDYSVLLPTVLAFGTLNLIANPVTLVAQYQERASIILLSKIFVVYNVVALLALLPVAGIYGAAIASGSAQVFKSLFIWWFVRDKARWENFAAMTSYSLLIWGCAVAMSFLLKTLVPAPHLVHMIFGMIICGVGAFFHVRGPALSFSDRQILGNLLRGREARLLRWLRVLPEADSKAEAPGSL